jgi:type IV pilus assembly protein PilM
MPYTAQFFAEKLNVPVDYFNPLRSVQIDPSINLEELAKVAHSFGEVVGLALRNLAQCPIELNLMPKSSLQRQKLSQKKPYFIATLCSLVLVAFAIGWFSYTVSADKRAALEGLNGKVAPLEKTSEELTAAQANDKKYKQDLDQLTALVQDKFYWVDLLGELRRIFLETERKFRQQKGMEAGVWIEKFNAGKPPAGFEATTTEEEEKPRMFWDERMARRYGLKMMPGMQSSAGPTEGGGEDATKSAKAAPSTNQIDQINLTCRGVNLNSFSPTANTELAFTLERELKASTNYFVSGTNDTTLTGKMVDDANATNTFTFEVTLKLKRPIKL